MKPLPKVVGVVAALAGVIASAVLVLSTPENAACVSQLTSALDIPAIGKGIAAAVAVAAPVAAMFSHSATGTGGKS